MMPGANESAVSTASARTAAHARQPADARGATCSSSGDSWKNALPDVIYAAVLAGAASDMVQMSEAWFRAIVDMALWELPIQAGASFGAACAVSVRSLGRVWLTILSAAIGLIWTAGPFYWHEMPRLDADGAQHLLIASAGLIGARFWTTWRMRPALLALDASTFAALFLPALQSMIFYAALLVVGVVVAIGIHLVQFDAVDPTPQLAILAAAYFVRAASCAPPVVRLLRRRLPGA
jgi:hypothetical protein